MKMRTSIGSGTALAVPALRTVRAVLPHTALQSVVSSSGLARRHSDAKGEHPMCREKALAICLSDAVANAANMRSGPTEAFVHSHSRPWTSAPCLTLTGTSSAELCSCNDLHVLHLPVFLPSVRLCFPHLSRLSPLRYYEDSDSCTAHLPCRSPRLLRHTFLSFRLQPRGLPGHRCSHHASVSSDFRTSPCMSRLVAAPRRIEFVLLRTNSSPPVALHPASRRRSYLRLRSCGILRHGLSPC